MAVIMKGSLLNRQDVWDIEPSKLKVSRELVRRFAIKHRGSVRISMGFFYTNEEWQKRRNKVINQKLP